MGDYTGRCACGAVRWTGEEPTTRNLICHCRDCQRALSAPFMASIGFLSDAVRWHGDTVAYESTPGTFRDFCPACGTRLTFRSNRWPDEVHVMAATLNDPGLYHPDAQVVVADQTPWLGALDDVPRLDGFQKEPT